MFAKKEGTHNFEEAKAVPEWRKTMEDELSSIQKNETWKLVMLPDRQPQTNKFEVGLQVEEKCSRQYRKTQG